MSLTASLRIATLSPLILLKWTASKAVADVRPIPNQSIEIRMTPISRVHFVLAACMSSGNYCPKIIILHMQYDESAMYTYCTSQPHKRSHLIKVCFYAKDVLTMVNESVCPIEVLPYTSASYAHCVTIITFTIADCVMWKRLPVPIDSTVNDID